jgi:NAD(P)H-dependent flavin oxidoreductase YrpB (nitropropane dioxygenase family)
LYEWRGQSTYIRRPPYWEGALAGERGLKGMRALAVLGDNITTDHLSPSNAILLDSAAGEYLAKMGLPEEDFNSYATHRGDHLTAQRATFANPTLINEMAVVDGKIQKGSLARIEPEGKVTRMWEAIETYMERKQPLIIIAGADYGQGSSRDWAAKGVRLAGVESIVAEGFEAGGHNGREETTTLCLIPMVRKATDIPLIAAGGIATGAAMAAMFCLGADGVQVGSRFVATHESSAHQNFKERITALPEGDTVLTLKELTPVRLIKNEFYAQVEAAYQAGASKAELTELLGRGRAKKGMFEGDLKEGELEIGQVSGLIKEIVPAAHVVEEMMKEFEQVKSNFTQLSF